MKQDTSGSLLLTVNDENRNDVYMIHLRNSHIAEHRCNRPPHLLLDLIADRLGIVTIGNIS